MKVFGFRIARLSARTLSRVRLWNAEHAGVPNRVKISNQNFLARSNGLFLVATDLYYVDVRKL